MFTDSSSEQPVAVFYDILKIPKVNTEVVSFYQEIQRHGTLFTCMWFLKEMNWRYLIE